MVFFKAGIKILSPPGLDSDCLGRPSMDSGYLGGSRAGFCFLSALQDRILVTQALQAWILSFWGSPGLQGRLWLPGLSRVGFFRFRRGRQGPTLALRSGVLPLPPDRSAVRDWEVLIDVPFSQERSKVPEGA